MKGENGRVGWTREIVDQQSFVRWRDSPPEIVLLHGAMLNALTWEGVMRAFPFAALALDLPGHGDSGWYSDGIYDVKRVASDVTDVIRAQAEGPIVLAGHSAGGLVAVAVAASAPELVRRLVLVESLPNGSRPSGGRLDLPERGTFDELVDAAARNRPRRNREDIARGVRRNARVQSDGSWTWKWDPAFRQTLASGVTDRARLTRAVIDLPMPVSIIAGTEAGGLRQDEIEVVATARQAPTRVVTVEGAGHNVHTECPAEVSRILHDELRHGQYS